MKHQQLTTTPEISKRMANVKLKSNNLERELALLIYGRGYRYRLNCRKIPGSPDIVLTKFKIAIFVDGSFWHGHNWEERKSKLVNNRDYWIAKIEENQRRDCLVNLQLRETGWTVLRFWDFEVKKHAVKCLELIELAIQGGDKMTHNQYGTMDEVTSIISESIGRTFRELDVSNRLNEDGNKGRIGHVIEEGLLRYSINNNQEPDIKNLMLEIKTAGYRYVRNQTMISSKERLVITMIDYMRDPYVDFNQSHLYRKIRNMLVLLYEYNPELRFGDYILSNFLHYQFDLIPEIDQQIILSDYHLILTKIRNGRAHELSESDTNYLGACTKGANRHSLTRQPRSNVLAMKRAFSFKSTYMTMLLRKEIQKSYSPRLIKSVEDIRGKGLDEFVTDLFTRYIGKTLSEIDLMLSRPVNRGSKSYLADYAARMLKVAKNELEKIEEFNKANIKLKTIRVTKAGRIKESMSFPAFDFRELADESWENSKIRSMFLQTRFLFLIFREVDDSKHEYIFDGLKFWNMPLSVLNKDVKEVWLKTRWVLNHVLNAHVSSNGTIKTNFPGSSENPVMHVRPHGIDASDAVALPQDCRLLIDKANVSSRALDFIKEHKFTRQCFWLNNTYILSIIKK